MEIVGLSTRCIYKGPIQEVGISNHQIRLARHGGSSPQLFLAFLEKGIPLAGSFDPGSGPVPAATPPSGL